MQIGVAIQAILLSIALGDKYTLLIREKEEGQKAFNVQLEKANKKLLKINADLDNFVYTASHDLKSPIANIEGLINTINLGSSYNEEEIKIIIDMMSHSVSKFKNTINDLTEIAKAQKNLGDDADLIDIKEVVNDILFLLQDKIHEAEGGINLDLQVPEIHFSKKNFRSILYNLISNAIKYRSTNRNLEVNISTVYEAEFLILKVQDNGLGISHSNQNKVFQLFKRAHDHVEGSGLGLYIVKRVIENAGGKIELTRSKCRYLL